MKYIVYDKETLNWEMVFCSSKKEGDELLEDIAKAMFMGSDFQIFHADEHICINEKGIKNDNKMFVLYRNGFYDIWQLGSKVEDMSGFIIPGLYYVRKVGLLVEEE